MTPMAGRPGVRGGPATRGFPPGSAQALVALVLGVAAGAVGLRRGEVVVGGLFLLIGVAGGVGLVRLLLRR